MRKVVVMISLFITILLITGCVSIPIGDGGKLKVSRKKKKQRWLIRNYPHNIVVETSSGVIGVGYF